MNSLVFAASWQLRRFQLPLFTLLVLLQRTPVLRLLTTAPAVWMSAPLGQTLRAGALVATALGAVDTLAGATRFSANPTAPASATVGTAFSAIYSVIGANGGSVPKSYTVTNLAPGLVTPGTFNGTRWLIVGSSGSISGTPTTAGTFAASITAWENNNGSGNSTTYLYTINVSGGVVVTAPSITSQPASQTVTEGGSVTFSVGATGTAPLDYQWFKGPNPISGATANTYTINPVQLSDADTYTARVANSADTVYSNAATLTVNPLVVAPSITSHPSTQTVNVGTQVAFSVGAAGTAPFNYQWFKDGAPLNGANSDTYTIPSAQATDAGAYRVDVGNAAGTVSSNTASLAVNKLAQTLTFAGPADQGFSITPLTLSATASSGLAPTFTLVSGPASLNGSTLTFSGLGTVTVQADQAGDATYAAAPSVTRSFTVSGNYADWQYTHFTGPELAAGALIGPNDIVTVDGLTNLVKYALGLDPKTIATTGLPVASSAAGNWTYTYTRPAGQTDITVTVEASANLVDWSTTNVTLTLVSTANGTDTWQATTPQAGAPNLFFRLMVTRP